MQDQQHVAELNLTKGHTCWARWDSQASGDAAVRVVKFYLDRACTQEWGRACVYEMGKPNDLLRLYLRDVSFDFILAYGGMPRGHDCAWLDNFERHLKHPAGLHLAHALGEWLKSMPAGLAWVRQYFLFPAGNGSSSDQVRHKLKGLYRRTLKAYSPKHVPFLMAINGY